MLINIINKIISKYPCFKIASKEDLVYLADFIEQEGMNVFNLGEIKCSRKPSIENSFKESFHKPVIITDHTLSTFFAISDVEFLINSKKEKAYYSSDLRIGRSANLRTKASFRNAYSELLNELDRKCFTAILSSNSSAIKSLTQKKSILNYNPIFEYSTKILVVTPFTYLLKTNSTYTITPVSETNKHRSNTFLDKKYKKSSFSHLRRDNHQEFIITSHGEVVGFFSIFKPKSRKYFIKPTSISLKVFLKIYELLFNNDCSTKIPWVYFTKFIIDQPIDKNEILKVIIKYLHQFKYIQRGEVIMLSQKNKIKSKNVSWLLPEIEISGVFYEISNNPSPYTQNIYLSPLEL